MISKEDIEHLKDLARVPARNATHSVAGGEFGEKETEKLARDLGGILEYVDQLKEVDVSNVPEMTRAVEGVKNIFRKDEGESHPPTPSLNVREGEEREMQSLSQGRVKDLIDAFPEKHYADQGTYLKVKSIL